MLPFHGIRKLVPLGEEKSGVDFEPTSANLKSLIANETSVTFSVFLQFIEKQSSVTI